MKNYLLILLSLIFALSTPGFAQTKVKTNMIVGDMYGGTAGNTKRIVLPKDTKTNLDALTRIQGNLLFDTTSSKPYYDDGTILKLIGSGGSGGGVVNFVTDGSAEDSTSSIFVPYQDSSGTKPTDGTGGTTTGITTARTTTAPLDGLASYTITKDAANRQGGGWSAPFTVPLAYRAKSNKITVDYIVNSGTFVAGSSTGTSDVIWYLYDVTNSQLIEPSSISVFSNSSTVSDRYQATFQTSATGASYRLIAHIASTSALAYELKVDNVTVTPQTYTYGTPVTDWTSYTPVGSMTTNTTYTGRKRQVGDTMEYQVNLAFAGAPNNVALSVALSETIDTTKLPSTVQYGTAIFGTGTGSIAGASKTFEVSYYDANNIVVTFTSSTAGTVSAVTGTSAGTIASGNNISLNFKVPILGKSSSVITSDNADTRVTAMQVTQTTPTATVTSSLSLLKFTVAPSSDTHTAFSTTTGGYTCPSAGFYRVTASAIIAASYSNTNVSVIGIGKNSTTTAVVQTAQVAGAAQGNLVPTIATTMPCNAGDVLYPLVSSQGSSPIINSVAGYNFFQVEKLQGPQAIAASDSVSVRYSSTAGQSLAAGTTTLAFPTKDYDSHNAFSGNNTFTAPISGKYNVSVKVTTNTLAGLSGVQVNILVAGSVVSQGSWAFLYSTASAYTFAVTDTVTMLAGQTLTTQIQNGFGSSITSTTNVGQNTISIVRTGN